ncbi:MAG TPA: chromosomal replication initiator protein DnaA [Acidimicrobiales bacterium]|nr:chromosomal replication initiator protein DnaA [Acidimicrobiales bacterium]
MQAGDLWTKCSGSLRDQVSESTWQLWLSGIEPVAFADGVFVLSVPNGLIRERVESRYLPMIEDTLANEVGSPVRGRLEVQEPGPADTGVSFDEVLGLPADPGLGGGAGLGLGLRLGMDPGIELGQERAERERAEGSARAGRESPAVQLDTKFTFETFVAASSNRLAHAAAQAVAETPGRSYNPLFIYGDSGLGKTHLLHAIGNYVTENYSRRKVLYVTTETFMNDFVDSLRTSTTLAFKRRYRDCDVLLIDDVQFMERKEGLQEEFFHTYNDLKGASKQMVLTSDRPPKSIETLEDRLRSRFLSGLITEIDPPDLETRLAILRSKSLSEHQEVPDDVLEFIASHVKDNIRELEGALIRICAFAKLNKEPISLTQAEHVLSDIVLAGEPRRISPQMILETTAASYGFPIEALCGPSRTRPLVTARQVAMYLTRELTDYSYPAIGRIFGKRDHTTVIHAVDKIAGQMQERRQIYEQVTELIQKIRAGSA